MEKTQLQELFSRPFDRTAWQQVLTDVFGVTDIRHEPRQLENESNDKVDGFEVGWLDTSDGYHIGIYEFEIKAGHKIAMNRVGLRSLVKSYTKFNVDAVLVVYHNDNEWRLSYICDLDDKEKKTTPKGYTYLFGDSTRSYRTPAERLAKLRNPNFESIRDAFSVEALNSEFFKRYKEQFRNFCNELSKGRDETKQDRDYVKKLLGRLVFLQFLQKKGWMGVPAENVGWTGGDPNYLKHLIDQNQTDTLLSDVLEFLFFETLNNPRANDEANSKLGDNIKIPYLNGGLFDRGDLDGQKIDFPYSCFKELLDFFSSYNFTIDENDPDDSEVGIDPEMLGHIFENLLEDNKDKGAFYTPKEIVHYMCRESLVQYLRSHTSEELHDAIDKLVRNGLSDFFAKNRPAAVTIDNLLREVKICDPAIGSGAFPMGLLSEIFHCRRLLYGHTKTGELFSPSKIKREIIQENIYGVDIEQGAVDIARLRFWLSLVVDEPLPEPLPNLDYKIMQGNSLLESFEGIDLSNFNEQASELDLFRTAETKEEINNLIKIYFSITNQDQKKKLHRQIDEQVKEHILRSCNNRSDIVAKVGTINFDNRPFFLWHVYFNEVFKKGGFDIIIGNPPYLRIQGIRDTNPKLADDLVNTYKAASGSFDLYTTFVERSLQIINPHGIVNFIMPVKWTNAAFGKGLRNIIAQRKSAYKIINFGAYQAFNASTYTGLHWFKPNSEELQYYELNRDLSTNKELGYYLDSLDSNKGTIIKAEKLTANVWILTVGKITEVLSQLELHPRRVSDVFDKIFQGLATSKDDVYFLYECIERDGIVTGFSKQLQRHVTIERGLLKPLLKGEDVHRYDNISTNRFVVFPYKVEDNKAILYTEKELIDKYPQGYSYLKECEAILRERERGRLIDDPFWYRYIYPKNLTLFDNEKLVAPEISLGGNFAYDRNGEFYSTTKIYGYIKKANINEGYKFWLALFNSKLFWFYLQNTGYVLRGGYFTFKTNYVNPFPIPQEIPVETENAVTILVDYILQIKSLPNNLSINEYVSNEVIVRLYETVIDALLYELYFKEEFAEADISFAKYVNSDFRPITSNDIDENINIIGSSYQLLREMNSVIRNNLKYMAIKLESTLAPILNM